MSKMVDIELMAVKEGGPGKADRLNTAQVLHCREHKMGDRDCYKLILSNGHILIVTLDSGRRVMLAINPPWWLSPWAVALGSGIVCAILGAMAGALLM